MKDKIVVMGVDLGMKNTITTSTYRSYGDETFRRAVKDNEWGFVERWVKKLSAYAVGNALESEADIIALEDLTVESMNISRPEKKAFHRLKKEMEERGSKNNNISVGLVNPVFTSQRCSWCGEIGIREGSIFSCLNCFRSKNADFNAARNVGIKYIGRLKVQDFASDCFLATYSGSKPAAKVELDKWVE